MKNEKYKIDFSFWKREQNVWERLNQFTYGQKELIVKMSEWEKTKYREAKMSLFLNTLTAKIN